MSLSLIMRSSVIIAFVLMMTFRLKYLTLGLGVSC